MRWVRRIVGAAVVVAAVGLTPAAAQPSVGDRAPEISAKDWINEAHTGGLASLRGKVVILAFFGMG